MQIPLKKASLAMALAACLTLLSGTPAQAVPNALDNAPASTLLYPYFEVDLGDTNGQTTLIAVHNVWATALLVNVTVWSDRGVPVYNFPVYLTGYDVQTINLRDILNGNLPFTASAGQDPTDTISNKGVWSQDINFASCTGTLPLAALDATTQTNIRNALTGQPSALFGGQCAGDNYGDNVARGYVTMDTINQCTTDTPASPGYFAAVATQQNALAGDWFMVHPANNFMQTDSAVAVEAVDFLNPGYFAAGNQTFYGRLVGWNASDSREPLPTTWAVQAQNELGTLHVWRDTKRTPAAGSCASPPADLAMERSVMLGMDGELYTASASSPLPIAAQRAAFDQATFGLPAMKTGFHYLSLNHNNGDVAGLTDPLAAQSHVTVIRHSQGRFSTGASAMPIDSGTQPTHSHPGGF